MGKTTRMKPKRLPEKLRQIRERLGLSQNGLIRQMGFEGVLVQASISGYESGTREPPLPVLLRYSEISGIWLNSVIDDQVDLPERLPCRRMQEGIKRPSMPRKANGKK
ncbi:MAG: helix-turn-helix transcriptional regulator [Acidobacteria bacterium]|nr:helix-turn-helix transcriptional regulator [Acidobacteriota bacterium]